jgi:ATP-dependent Clp protease adaptor protein ClpS
MDPILIPGKLTGDDLDLEGMCQIVLYNDDVNTFDHVVRSLMVVFGHPIELSSKLAMDAHTSGRTVAEVEGAEKAIFHKEQLISFGLTAEVEKI